jgi:hypothetical protein
MNALIRNQTRSPIGSLIGSILSAAAVALLFLAPVDSVHAQNPIGDVLAPIEALNPLFGGVAVGSSYPFRASTPGESFARGRADVIRAQGQFNLLTSEAAINAQEARSRAIVNSQEAVKAYFNRRQLNRDYRQSLRGPRPTREDFERYARAKRPAPLSPSELNTLTGQVAWPVLLKADHFTPQRTRMEELLDRWAVSRHLGAVGNFGTEEHLAVREMTDHLQEELRKQVRNLPPQDYVAAKRFLRSLEYQVTQPSTSGVSLASMP